MVIGPALRSSAARGPTRCPRTTYAAPSLTHGAPDVLVLWTRKATGTRTTPGGSAAAGAIEQFRRVSATAPMVATQTRHGFHPTREACGPARQTATGATLNRPLKSLAGAAPA